MKDVEIGTIGEAKIYMRFDELVRIANRELQEHTEFIERHNSRLLYLLDVATEALKFYANSDSYEKSGRCNLSEIDEDGGEWAQKVLEEIEHDVFSEEESKKENARIREALEVILDESQKDEPCIQAIRAVAYTALKENKE